MIDKKFNKNLLWGYLSFVIMASSGLLMNVFVLKTYNTDGLGIFNQILAFYVVISQFAVGGIHHSMLKHTAETANNKKLLGIVILNGLLVSIIVGALFYFLTYLLSAPLGRLYKNENFHKGILYIAPGIFFYSLNKVQLAVLNGLNMFKHYSIGQILRSFLILFSLSVLIYLQVSPPALTACFTITEVILFLILLFFYIFPILKNSNVKISLPWGKAHLFFGLKSFMSGVIMELNMRADVLILGLFVDVTMLGIYSFVAMIVEGIYNILIVIRTTINPSLVILVQQKNHSEIRRIFRKIKKIVYPSMTFLSLLIFLLYNPVVNTLFREAHELEIGRYCMLILFIGLTIYSAFLPFDWILLQGGMPWQHTQLTTKMVLLNIILNFIFIPIFGILGAALGTALTFVISIFFLTEMVNKYLNISFFSKNPITMN